MSIQISIHRALTFILGVFLEIVVVNKEFSKIILPKKHKNTSNLNQFYFSFHK